jgi:hypothetical protein
LIHNDLDDSSVFPNPSDGIFNLELNEPSKLSIFNILGELVSESHVNPGKNRIDLSEQSSGVYVFHYSASGIKHQISVIKK